MPDDVYSNLKIFHHRERVDAARSGSHPFPIHVQIIPTNVCNQRCRFCSYRCPGYSSNETFDPRESIPFPKLAEIINDCEDMGVRAIEITGGGEPTCHPQFLNLCEAILGAEIDLGLVTNGSRWSEDHVRLLSEAKWIRFSIDAGARNTYAMVRRVKSAVYDQVRAAVRRQHESRIPEVNQIIGVGFVVTRDNWSEIAVAAERARDDGADNIRISAVFQDKGAAYFDSFGMEAAKLCHQAKDLANERFRVFDLFSERVHDLVVGRPTRPFCGLQHFVTYIGADLNVYRCCVVAYNHVGLLGSIAEVSFREFWQSLQTAKALDDFDARVCPRCMFNGKNEIIAYALSPNPPHVNFL